MKVRLRNPTRIVELEGPARVREVLQRLQINPDTVLVIRGGDLVTREERLEDADEVEVRPVISGGQDPTPPRPRRKRRGPGQHTKCRRCGEPAKVDVPRANAAFCRECFVRYIRNQIEKAITEHAMFDKDDRLLVAVSGGKDSLALWDILLDLGYDATGFHLALWTGEDYAAESRAMCEKFATARGAPLVVRDLKEQDGFTIEEVARLRRRVPCSVCGLAKRYLLNLAAVEGGYDVLVTGHNLDDEAATLLGNVLHWSNEFIARQMPVLPRTHAKLKRKVKPLYRVAERETAAYAILKGIDYIVEECPLVAGNTALRYKDALNLLESQSPGTKQQFFFGFLDKTAPLFASQDAVELRECRRCGMPTPGDVCAYCRATAPLKLAQDPPSLDDAEVRLDVAEEGVVPAAEGGG